MYKTGFDLKTTENSIFTETLITILIFNAYDQINHI